MNGRDLNVRAPEAASERSVGASCSSLPALIRRDDGLFILELSLIRLATYMPDAIAWVQRQ